MVYLVLFSQLLQLYICGVYELYRQLLSCHTAHTTLYGVYCTDSSCDVPNQITIIVEFINYKSNCLPQNVFLLIVARIY